MVESWDERMDPDEIMELAVERAVTAWLDGNIDRLADKIAARVSEKGIASRKESLDQDCVGAVAATGEPSASVPALGADEMIKIAQKYRGPGQTYVPDLARALRDFAPDSLTLSAARELLDAPNRDGMMRAFGALVDLKIAVSEREPDAPRRFRWAGQ